jgi:hypothetical protein
MNTRGDRELVSSAGPSRCLLKRTTGPVGNVVQGQAEGGGPKATVQAGKTLVT